MPHTRGTWIGAGPMRTGAVQDVSESDGRAESESDGAGALHTADRARSRTHDRAVIVGSGWAGAGRGHTSVTWTC